MASKIEVVIKESKGFKLILKVSPVANPSSLNHVEMVQQVLSSTGDVDQQSTYEFFMENSEIKTLSEALQQCLAE